MARETGGFLLLCHSEILHLAGTEKRLHAQSKLKRGNEGNVCWVMGYRKQQRTWRHPGLATEETVTNSRLEGQGVKEGVVLARTH